MENIFGCFLKVNNAKIQFSNYEKITHSQESISFSGGLNLLDISNSVLFVKEIKVENAIQIDLPLFIKADSSQINIIDISIINI